MITNFSGNSTHKLDSKNRVSIPAQFRKWTELEQCEFVISIGPDPCLVVHPAVEWDKFVEKLATRLSTTNKKHRAYIRAYTQDATRVKCDKQGRVLIPQKLLNFGKIQDNVKIIGTINTIEIWDQDTADNYEISNLPPDDDYFVDIDKLLE